MIPSEFEPDTSPDRGSEIRAYLDGSMDSRTMRAFEQDILADPALAEAVYEEGQLDGLLEEERAMRVAAEARSQTRWWRRGALPLTFAAAAAAATLVFVSRPERGDPPSPILRSGAGEMRALMPAGDLAALPDAFVWTRHPEAVVYQVELYDVSRRLVFAGETPETTLAWPAEAEALRSGSWRVVPSDAAGDPLPSSRPVAFRAAP